MAYPTSNIAGVKFDRVDDAAAFPVGTLVEGSNGTAWVYGVAGGAIASVGQAVVLDAAWSATLASTANSPFGLRTGVAPAAFAQGQFGWFQIGGVCPAIQVNAACAANVKLNTTATAGQLDDDGTAGAKTASGIVLTTARGGTAGTAPGVIFGPTVGATL